MQSNTISFSWLSIAMFIVLLFTAGIMLSGCMTAKRFVHDKPALSLAVKAGVYKLVTDEKVDPNRLTAIVNTGMDFVSKNPEAKADAIIDVVRSEIHWSRLSDSESIIVNQLLIVIEERIASEIERGDIDSDTVAAIGEVASWIRDSATAAAKAK